MTMIIKIEPNENGSHDNWVAGYFADIPCPDGWATVPENMPIPATFPFVNIAVENGVVVQMTAGVVPPTPEPEPQPPSEQEQIDDLTDAVIEVGGIVAEQDTRLDDLENAVLELAAIIGGE